MPDLVNYTSTSIATLMSRLDKYKHNPSGIQRIMLEYLDEVTNGEVDIVDPTNPFVFLLESSSVNTALAINENLVNLRKQYASLAQSEQDLYLHLSDKDFLNRFSSPAETDFTIVLQVNDLLNKMPYDDIEKCHKATIPRDTYFEIDGIIFTLQYPIDIRKFDNGVVNVSYDGNIESPIQRLTTNIIDYTIRRDTSLVDWLFFKVPVLQVAISTTYFPLQQSITFSNDIIYGDKYYFARVYYRNNNTQNKWQEIRTTHTDQVFDSFEPTAILKVYSNYINIFIPTVYLTTGLLSGELRVDLYTTKGALTINLVNYKTPAFTTKIMAIDEERDLNIYTNALVDMSYYAYSDQLVSGGTDGITFEELRKRAIFNSTGVRQLPITNIQLDAEVDSKGFDLVRNVDVVTNRIFLATKKLPKPLNAKLITSANIGINTFSSTTDYLRSLDTVKDNTNRLTILSKNIYRNINGQVELVSPSEILAIKSMVTSAMVDHINSVQYLYSPFYYVLELTKGEYETRAYNLDLPTSRDLSFKKQNQTLQLPVNTSVYSLYKIDEGYRLVITTKSGNFYKQLADNLVGVQLAFYPNGEKNLAYINGVLVNKTEDGERIYSFDLITSYDIDENNQINITNAKMFNNENIETWVNLVHDIYLIHHTASITDNFVVDDIDSMLGKFLIPDNSAGNTLESLTLELGTALKSLWNRSRAFATGFEYQKYATDIPMLYDEVIYQPDPVTGSIFTIDSGGNINYNIIHQKNDPVLTDTGEPVYLHRKGDVVLDPEGKPVRVGKLQAVVEIDILYIDGKYFFTTEDVFINYRQEATSILNTWITRDISEIQTKLLEKTHIFFYPKTTLGMVKVYPNSTEEAHIAAEQSFTVDLYVNNNVYVDNTIRQQLTEGTIKLLDSYISNLTVNMTEITTALKELYGDSVVSLNITGLGGSRNYTIVNLANEQNRLCLKKQLFLQQDGKLIIVEDVAVTFNNIERLVID